MWDMAHATVDLYLDGMGDRADATRTEYRRELEWFWSFCSKANDPAAITTMDVELYLHNRCAGRSNSTRKKAIAILGAYFDYLHQRAMVPTNVVRPITRPRVHVPEPTWWTPEEVRRILATPQNPRDHLLLETLARTGQRVGVVRRLTWDRVRTDLKEPVIHFAAGKRGKIVSIPMDKELVHDFVTFHRLSSPPVSSPVFQGKGGAPVSVQTVNRVIARACRAAGVRVSSAHEFRRSAATNLLQAGVPFDVVSRDILQHGDPSTTMKHYRGAESERVRQALRGLPY